MQTEQLKKQDSPTEFNFNLKVIMLMVAVEILILMCISFVKIYVDKKHSTINKMREEVDVLEKVFIDDTEYSSYVLSQMASLVKNNYNKSENIDSILSHYSLNLNEKNFFGWHGFYWLDKNHIVKNANIDGSINRGTSLSFLSNVRLSKIAPEKVFYGLNPNTSKYFTTMLDLAYGVTNENGEFVGTLLLQMQTSSLLEDLEIYRRNNFTNFAVVDSKLNVVTSYPINAASIGLVGRTIVSQKLMDDITKINFFSNSSKEFSYINMINGTNYFAKKIRNMPYLLVVSIDAEYIRSTLTQKIAIKFIEIIILASFFLVLVLLIYKRETWLRAKAERASNMATKATIAKSEFLSYTAHEIRSPLGFILTGSEIMDKKLFGPIPQQYQEYVQGINHNARLILDFITDILDERNIINDNIRLEDKICDVKELVEKAILTNRTRFNSSKIAIEKIIPDNLPYLMADARKIMQVLSNLLSNSYKYSLDNTKITVEAKMSAGKLIITIADQGIGMEEDEIQIAMTKYGTVHNGKSGNAIESYGLGLSIVLMLMKAHNAEIAITSKVSIGTTVTLTFPKSRVIAKIGEK